MIPGVSRAGATIVGGLSQKLNRRQATEFSFFLAVPTMFAATVMDLLHNKDILDTSNVSLLVIGCIVAFVVAIVAIKAFIGYLAKHGFKVFGYYRILVGAIILILLGFGISLSTLG